MDRGQLGKVSMGLAIVLVLAVATQADRHHHRLVDDGSNVVTHECFFGLNDTIALDVVGIGSQKSAVVLRRPVNIHLCPMVTRRSFRWVLYNLDSSICNVVLHCDELGPGHGLSYRIVMHRQAIYGDGTAADDLGEVSLETKTVALASGLELVIGLKYSTPFVSEDDQFWCAFSSSCSPAGNKCPPAEASTHVAASSQQSLNTPIAETLVEPMAKWEPSGNLQWNDDTHEWAHSADPHYPNNPYLSPKPNSSIAPTVSDWMIQGFPASVSDERSGGSDTGANKKPGPAESVKPISSQIVSTTEEYTDTAAETNDEQSGKEAIRSTKSEKKRPERYPSRMEASGSESKGHQEHNASAHSHKWIQNSKSKNSTDPRPATHRSPTPGSATGGRRPKPHSSSAPEADQLGGPKWTESVDSSETDVGRVTPATSSTPSEPTTSVASTESSSKAALPATTVVSSGAPSEPIAVASVAVVEANASANASASGTIQLSDSFVTEEKGNRSRLSIDCWTLAGSACWSGAWAWQEMPGRVVWFANCVPMTGNGRNIYDVSLADQRQTITYMCPTALGADKMVRAGQDGVYKGFQPCRVLEWRCLTNRTITQDFSRNLPGCKTVSGSSCVSEVWRDATGKWFRACRRLSPTGKWECATATDHTGLATGTEECAPQDKQTTADCFQDGGPLKSDSSSGMQFIMS